MNEGGEKMSYKKVSYAALILLILFGIGYFVSINTSATINPKSSAIGPNYFPNILAGLLIVLSLVSLIQTIRKEDKKIIIPQFKLILFTIVLTVLFFVSWGVFGWFYVQTLIFLTVLFTVYRHRTGKLVHIIATSALTALIVTASIYFLFGRLMVIQF